MANTRCFYLAEGQCEEKLVRALQEKPNLVLAGNALSSAHWASASEEEIERVALVGLQISASMCYNSWSCGMQKQTLK